jgi:hypothetical protein
VIDGLEDLRAGFPCDFFDDARHAFEIFPADHKINVAVEAVGKALIAGKDDVRFALGGQGIQKNPRHVRLHIDVRRRPGAGFHEVGGSQANLPLLKSYEPILSRSYMGAKAKRPGM